MPAQVAAGSPHSRWAAREAIARRERTHMLVILPMHHRSPSAAGTVPTSMSGVLAELAEPALLGAVIEHPSGGHDAQLHVHGAPEAVSKVTASTAPAAAVGRVRCAALPRGNRRVRTADGRRGGGRRPSRDRRRRQCRRRRSCTSTVGVTASRTNSHPCPIGRVQRPSEVAAREYCPDNGDHAAPSGAQRSARSFTHSGGTRRGVTDPGVRCEYSRILLGD